MLWRHYQAEFIYPKILYEKHHTEYVQECVSEDGLSKEACLEQHSLFTVKDYKRVFRKKMEGHEASYTDIRLDTLIKNYLKFMRLENYQYETCLQHSAKDKDLKEIDLAVFCKCRASKLKDISLDLKPIKKPTKGQATKIIQKANSRTRQACLKQ